MILFAYQPFLWHPNVAVSRSAANKILLTCFSLIILFKYFCLSNLENFDAFSPVS